MRSFFSDPNGFGRSLLDPLKSGELSVEKEKLEEHLLKTYSDVLLHEFLQEKLDIPTGRCRPVSFAWRLLHSRK